VAALQRLGRPVDDRRQRLDGHAQPLVGARQQPGGPGAIEEPERHPRLVGGHGRGLSLLGVVDGHHVLVLLVPVESREGVDAGIG
jgi:hypothetical protein